MEALESRILLSLDSVGVDLRDFNGDGREDLIEFQEDGEWWVGLSSGGAPLAENADAFATTIWADWAPASNFTHVTYGDFNADGNADILGIDLENTAWVGLSNGSNAFVTTRWEDLDRVGQDPRAGTTTLHPPLFPQDIVHIVTGDFDEFHPTGYADDGMTDLAVMTASGDWFTLRSHGTFFFRQHQFIWVVGRRECLGSYRCR